MLRFIETLAAGPMLASKLIKNIIGLGYQLVAVSKVSCMNLFILSDLLMSKIDPIETTL